MTQQDADHKLQQWDPEETNKWLRKKINYLKEAGISLNRRRLKFRFLCCSEKGK